MGRAARDVLQESGIPIINAQDLTSRFADTGPRDRARTSAGRIAVRLSRAAVRRALTSCRYAHRSPGGARDSRNRRGYGSRARRDRKLDSTLPDTRAANVSPHNATSGQPSHSASLAVVCEVYGNVSSARSAARNARDARVRESRRDHDALGIDAVRLAASLQICAPPAIVFQQPQHAVRDLMRADSSSARRPRADLHRLVEAAEDESVLGQSRSPSRERRRRCRPLAIVRLIAVRHAQNRAPSRTLRPPAESRSRRR